MKRRLVEALGLVVRRRQDRTRRQVRLQGRFPFTSLPNPPPQEHAHHTGVPEGRCLVERRYPEVVEMPAVCASLQQELHHSRMPLPGRVRERGESVHVLRPDLVPVLYQHLHALLVALHGRDR
ncbi:hypothetical protein NSK_002090 [Nannochloropsis salina CCMP1776]|uniref:Uncharacterized protein n=1 Tax=Nannochloropsis salina CCMP1776 TaxID=1027361 RepID=A0A4D9D8W6_9STRA|nr:hypothetical protein NSK_002090 [Nannochloropsis salina CCMP1776]|eukprot:TFJ86433.1 hypothetical protein NSK_002090 [Nannochloropsis salina CCMP1776]